MLYNLVFKLGFQILNERYENISVTCAMKAKSSILSVGNI